MDLYVLPKSSYSKSHSLQNGSCTGSWWLNIPNVSVDFDFLVESDVLSMLLSGSDDIVPSMSSVLSEQDQLCHLCPHHYL